VSTTFIVERKQQIQTRSQFSEGEKRKCLLACCCNTCCFWKPAAKRKSTLQKSERALSERKNEKGFKDEKANWFKTLSHVNLILQERTFMMCLFMQKMRLKKNLPIFLAFKQNFCALTCI
jgi:hypothetical protein